jgi:hypothetical protein
MMLAVSVLPAVIFGVACVQGDADPTDEIMAEVRAYAEAMAPKTGAKMARPRKIWRENSAKGFLPPPIQVWRSTWNESKSSWTVTRQRWAPSFS